MDARELAAAARQRTVGTPPVRSRRRATSRHPAASTPGRGRTGIETMSAASALFLQRTAGNAATSAWALGRTPVVQRQPEIRVTTGVTSELRQELGRLQRERATAPAHERGDYDKWIDKLRIYIAERGDSELAECPVSLTFDGSRLVMSGAVNTGRVSRPSLAFAAVSGKPDEHGRFDYSPERQRQRNIGPIPEGSYWLDPRQMQSLWLKGLLSGSFGRAWGSHRITIHPFDATATFGRGGFFIHGGADAGSAGCIDLTGRMETFAVVLARSVRGPCQVGLTVRYEASP